MSYKQKIRLIQAKFKGCPRLIEYMVKDIPKPPKSRLGYLFRCAFNFFTK